MPGIAYDPPGIRIDRLRETVGALRELFAGGLVTHHRSPRAAAGPLRGAEAAAGVGAQLLIGGNGDRLLALAAEVADIVSFTGFGPDREGGNVLTHFSRRGLADRVALVGRRSAGRAVPPELNVLLQTLVITDDREQMASEIAQRHGQSIVDVLTCPFLAFGTVEEDLRPAHPPTGRPGDRLRHGLRAVRRRRRHDHGRASLQRRRRREGPRMVVRGAGGR